jgi:hypothetical protein
METNMTSDKERCTFISYPRINTDFALKLALDLREAGFQIWLDQLDIPTGVRWDDEIEKALNDCEIFMVVLTPAAINSNNVKDEIGYAIDNHKHIFPVLLEPCNIPLRLRRFQYVDFSALDHESGVEKAKKILTSLIKEPTVPRIPTNDPHLEKPEPELANKKSYKNQANSDHPATLMYLVDISGSMNATMRDGKTRIDVAKNAIQIAYAQMIQRSMRQGKIHPRYRVGMIAYSDEIYDVYGNLGSIISIDKIKDEGIPLITPQKSTNMAKAFRYAAKLIKDDIQKWSQKWLEECPPPMVINITDCEYNEKEAQDPLQFALDLQKISVPDGNVLVENIFITDQISVPSSAQDWQGYRFNDVTGDPYGDKLLAMSSLIPSTYAQILREQAGLKIREEAAMMFPGITREFIKFGFVMSIVTGSQIMQTSRAHTPK